MVGPLPEVLYSQDERHYRKLENEEATKIAQAEGDRLLKLGDEKGAHVAYKIAGALRIRRESHLEPF